MMTTDEQLAAALKHRSTEELWDEVFETVQGGLESGGVDAGLLRLAIACFEEIVLRLPDLNTADTAIFLDMLRGVVAADKPVLNS